jgi:TadE-like protein
MIGEYVILLMEEAMPRISLSNRLKLKAKKGQALVESAIIIPLMTFVILGMVQLAMVQHARLMTEYAAFNAARAGIVWNADRFVMENAAIVSLLPTFEGLVSEASAGNITKMVMQIVQRALIYQAHRRIEDAANFIRAGTDTIIAGLPTSIGGSASSFRDAVLGAAAGYADTGIRGLINSIFGDDGKIVSVDIISPAMGDFGGALGDKEVNFDDIKKDDNWRDATRLSIQVTYLYTMRIPFANRIIHTAYIAAQVGQELFGAVYNPRESADANLFSKSGSLDLGGRGSRLTQQLWDAGQGGVFMIPLRTTYTMRMQSNPYRRSIAIH